MPHQEHRFGNVRVLNGVPLLQGHIEECRAAPNRLMEAMADDDRVIRRKDRLHEFVAEQVEWQDLMRMRVEDHVEQEHDVGNDGAGVATASAGRGMNPQVRQQELRVERRRTAAKLSEIETIQMLEGWIRIDEYQGGCLCGESQDVDRGVAELDNVKGEVHDADWNIQN